MEIAHENITEQHPRPIYTQQKRDGNIIMYGLGPWYVALFFNMNDKKKQSQLRLHGNVHWFASLKNLVDAHDCWVNVMMVGPFYRQQDAVDFYSQWSRQTRGRARRLRLGYQLLMHHRKRLPSLWMWTQALDKPALQQRVKALRKRHAPLQACIGKTNMRRARRLHALLRFRQHMPASYEQRNPHTWTLKTIQTLRKKRIE